MAVERIALTNAEGWLLLRVRSDGSSILIGIAARDETVCVMSLYGAIDQNQRILRDMLVSLELVPLPDLASASAVTEVQENAVGIPNSGMPARYFTPTALGKFILPFGASYPGGQPRQITQSGEGGRTHHCPATASELNCGAIDFGVPGGTPVYAVYDGFIAVTRRGVDRFGNYIVLEHDGSSTYSLYAHLDTIAVDKGERVQQGQLIGTSGNTGYYVGDSGYHLHFGITVLRYDWSTSSYFFQPVNINQYPGLIWKEPEDPDTGCEGIDCGDALGIPEFFPDRDLQGVPQAFGFVASNLGAYEIGNDNIESLRVPEGYSVVLYRDIAEQGWGPFLGIMGPGEVQNLDGLPVPGNQASALIVYDPSECPLLPAMEWPQANHPLSIQGASSASNVCPVSTISSDGATLVSHVTLPLDAHVSPNQEVQKTWRVRNAGSTTWGSGYELAFVGGNQMGASSGVPVQTTIPGETADLSVSITAPGSPGTYVGHWRLRNSEGTYFGDELRLQVAVQGETPPSQEDLGLDCASCPSVVTPGEQFRPIIRATVNSGQLLESRGDMLLNTDGNLYGAFRHVMVVGTVNPGQTHDFTFYADDPITAPTSEGTYETKWRIWRDGHWDGPELTIRFEVQSPASLNHPPNKPSSADPDWGVFQSTPTLHAQHHGDPDGDAIAAYYFEIFDSHDNRNSGWIASNSWTPPGLGYYGYQWHVKVRDSRGGESTWSDTRRFLIEDPTPQIYSFGWQWCRPAWADGATDRICFCADTNAGTLRLQVNSATDGSGNGEWQVLNELGSSKYDCATDDDRPPTWTQLEAETGTHLVRLYARRDGGWEAAAVQDLQITLPSDRRPNAPFIQQPQYDTYLNSRAVHLDWIDALRTTGYHLEISADPGYGTLLVDEYLPGGTSEYDYTFPTDYETVYWRVTATGPHGANEATSRFHIDVTKPTASMHAMSAVSADTSIAASWGGTDARSGVRWYDVQYRDGERGEWVTWLAHTTKIGEIFQGQPGHTYCFRARAMDEVGNWSDYATPDGDTCTLIDPTSAPAVWWDDSYAYKHNIYIVNQDPNALTSHWPIHLHFDGSTVPSAEEIYNASQAATKGQDVRVVYQDSVQLDRVVQRFTPTQIDIRFPLVNQIGGFGHDEASYQLYYGNSSSGTPPASVNNVFLPAADANTVGLWHYQDGTGSTVVDTSGRGHNGTFSSPGWADGFLGSAGVFNGSSSEVNCGNHSDFNLSAMTLEGWVYLDDLMDVYGGHIFNKETYWFRATGRALHTKIFNGEVTTNDRLDLHKWYHVAVTFDGVSQYRIYINGQLAGQKTESHAPYNYDVPLKMGWVTNWPSHTYFQGMMQHMRVSNVVRTDFSYARVTQSPSVELGATVAKPASGTPDLVLQHLSAHPADSSTLEQGVIVQAVVKNEGDGPTVNGFYTDFYADHVPSGPGDVTGSVRFLVNDPIGPGAVVTLTTVIADPAELGMMHTSDGLAAMAESSAMLYVQTDSTGVVGEADNANNIDPDGVRICVAAPDGYEGVSGDDSPSDAGAISVGDTQLHNLHKTADQDWLKFAATAEQTYATQTGDLGLRGDTCLYLYASDGTTLLEANDDTGGTLASRIEWTAPADGTYYVAVKHWNPNAGGCGTSYSISIQVLGEGTVYLPVVVRSDQGVPR